MVSRSRVVLVSCLTSALVIALPLRVAATTPTTIFGYFDPKTKVFTPATPGPAATSANAPHAAAAGPILRSGTIEFKATVKLVSDIPSAATFSSGISVAVADPYTTKPPSYTNSAGTAAPTIARSGTTVTVTASFPYDFAYTNGSDKMTVNFYISYYGSPDHSFIYTVPIAVPANGAKTPIVLSAEL